MPKLEQNPTEFEQNYHRASMMICEGHLARIGMLIITMCGRDYGCAESYFLQLDALIAPNAFDNLRIALILASNYANGDKHCLSGDKVLMSGDKLTTNGNKVPPSGDK
ncbi:hypothetical protein [Sporosarcina luteola]|uniref:hypothetical protein n=1 Tax=Sporosarcina luteola TaxID=582850 RepID=UPI00203EE431|nr:hypothetical protein [Sporosarcina luteola]MCM3709478.1 hypothetical protein [Sporosarcina luteola]